jgi:hypothetical protein
MKFANSVPNFIIHNFYMQYRELKTLSIGEGPDQKYGAVR